MRVVTLLAVSFIAVICSAKEHDDYQKATVVRMDSKSCGTQENGGKTVAGDLLGTDGQHRKTQEVLCQEYVLQTDRVVYHVRPADDKHPTLLPIGETAQFRIRKDRLILRVPEGDGKEHEYIVVSMAARQDSTVQSANQPQ